MRVLVTGLSGFVGSALKPVLLERGHEVHGVQRGDETSANFTGFDVVVHLANVANPRTKARVLWDINVHGTRRTGEMAASAGVRRFIFVSSIKASGEATARGRRFDGSENAIGADVYALTKLHAERALAELSAHSGMELVVLRPPLVYGPGVKGSFRALLAAVAFGCPLPFRAIDNQRSLLFVANLASAIALCVERAEAPGRVYVLSDGSPLSTPELCRRLGEALGRPARLFPFPAMVLNRLPRVRALIESLEIDDSAIRADLGWTPPISIDAAMRRTAQWYVNR